MRMQLRRTRTGQLRCIWHRKQAIRKLDASFSSTVWTQILKTRSAILHFIGHYSGAMWRSHGVSNGIDYPASIQGSTPLYRASLEGDMEPTRILLDHGTDIAAQTDNGYTPLHAASFGGHIKVIWVIESIVLIRTKTLVLFLFTVCYRLLRARYPVTSLSATTTTSVSSTHRSRSTGAWNTGSVMVLVSATTPASSACNSRTEASFQETQQWPATPWAKGEENGMSSIRSGLILV
jgi:hypothetical protein